jgi:FkbM family methyltransferase
MIRKLKNWYVIPFIYYNIYRKKFFILKLKNGLRIKLRSHSTDLQAFANVWIIEEYNEDDFEIKNPDIIIDVGGHIGLFTLYASQFCKTGKIISVEPVYDNYELLIENIKTNNVTNVVPVGKAVFDSETKARIFLNKIDQSAHSLMVKGKNFVEVETISLKQIMDENSITNCDLLKLDCEGSEYRILKSLPDDYLEKIKKICMEYHLSKNDSVEFEELKIRLNSLDFFVTIKPTSENLGLLFARK